MTMYLELKEQVNEHYEINHGNQIRLCPYVIHTYSTHLELCRYLSNYYICGINNLPPTRLLRLHESRDWGSANYIPDKQHFKCTI